ncbi:polyketide beta-ketoacyl:ACP synthase [Streptomyces durbertensis]|uniref:Polyketide beta-ketoacyl:ACP synthase n=1 Tax=Streptomyces durbertensis TaxID=2448886 RepID=A0ABR6EAL7_9ACTN|nr:beta-ketoacyl synthase N-terminal-like domain-containing protein [Streptomyces durbertensis]MBB1242381.1 polyketide beta-ketoacyl:ACP synthase [Streptomyces durbertensis]
MNAAAPTGVRRPVAITGAAVLGPLGERLEDFTAALLAGRSAVSLTATGPPGPAAEPPPLAALRDFTVAGWAERHLADLPETAGLLRRVVGRAALPAQTGACVALRAVLDAGLPLGPGGEAWGERTALIVAGGGLALAHQARNVLGHHLSPGRVRPSYALTHLDVDVVGAASEVCGVRGEGWAVGGASASGTAALIQGARAVAAGWVERALVVAPVAELSPAETEAFRRSGAMADESWRDEPTRMCRPFDRDRQGFVRGEGAAAVLLELPDAARSRGVEVLAEVAGAGQRLDARRGTEPDRGGQVAAMRAALDSAGLAPGDVDYVNAHGTGSVVGDAVEAAALLEVFGAASPPLVNSTKPLTGHCLTAAGLVEAVAVVGQLRSGACHPSPNVDHPMEPALSLVGPGAVHSRPRTAVSNSFAFGGVNTSVVLRLPHAAPVPDLTPDKP